MEDFAYMEGVVDVTELKEKIVNTGAEVKAQLLFYSTITAHGNPKARKLLNKPMHCYRLV